MQNSHHPFTSLFHEFDMNKLDLCQFRSTDPEVYALKGDGSNSEALIDAVLRQLKEYDPQKLLRA